MAAMTYELWHAPSANLLEEFDSEVEALKAVRGYLEANGPEMIDDLVLGAVPDDGLAIGDGSPPALQGRALLARMQQVGLAGDRGGEAGLRGLDGAPSDIAVDRPRGSLPRARS